MDGNFPNLVKEILTTYLVSLRVLNWIRSKKLSPKHIIIKHLKREDKKSYKYSERMVY